MALACCILGSFLGVGCHCFPPPLDVPTFASRCLHMQATWETSSERRNYGWEMAGQFCLWFRLPCKPRVLWHAAQICDMGDGFTPPPCITTGNIMFPCILISTFLYIKQWGKSFRSAGFQTFRETGTTLKFFIHNFGVVFVGDSLSVNCKCAAFWATRDAGFKCRGRSCVNGISRYGKQCEN